MTPVRLLVLMCLFLALTVLGMHGFAALLPELIAEWGLSNTEAGWLGGMPYFAYMLAVPFLTITDRIDARRLLIGGALIHAAGYLGFGLFADDFWSAFVFRALQGIGFAGTYMPGVKALSDRIEGPFQARAASLYVSSFAIGASFSFLIASLLADAFGWRWAFLVPGLSNLAAMALALVVLPPAASKRAAGPQPALLDFRPVLRNRRVTVLIAAYFCHSVELLGARGWTVAYLTFAFGQHPESAPALGIAAIATVLNLIGIPPSMIGGEIGARIGMARAASAAMLISALFAFVAGFGADWPFALMILPVVLHNLFLLADTGSLSGGIVAAADPALRGMTMALFALSSAVGGFLGPVLFGVVLDLAGADSVLGWGLAFASLGAVVGAGGLGLCLAARERPAERGAAQRP